MGKFFHYRKKFEGYTGKSLWTGDILDLLFEKKSPIHREFSKYGIIKTNTKYVESGDSEYTRNFSNLVKPQ